MKKKYLNIHTLSLAAVLVLFPNTLALADDNDKSTQEVDATVTIEGGDLEYYPDQQNIIFEDIDDDGNINADGEEGVIIMDGGVKEAVAELGEHKVVDNRASGEGYSLQVNATQFVNDGDELPMGSLFMNRPDYENLNEDNGSPIETFNINEETAIDTDSPTTILTAGDNEGMGEHLLKFNAEDLKLKLSPLEVKEGTYNSVLTFKLNNGPAGE